MTWRCTINPHGAARQGRPFWIWIVGCDRWARETVPRGCRLSAVRPRRVSDEVSIAVPILVDDRVLAAVSIRFSGTAVPLKMAVERFLPRLRESAQKIRQSFVDQQRDPPHHHHRATPAR